jgi:type II secretory pathway component PulK
MRTLTFNQINGMTAHEVRNAMPFVYVNSKAVEVRVTRSSGTYFLAEPKHGKAARLSLEDLKKDFIKVQSPKEAKQNSNDAKVQMFSKRLKELEAKLSQAHEQEAEAYNAYITAKAKVSRIDTNGSDP